MRIIFCHFFDSFFFAFSFSSSLFSSSTPEGADYLSRWRRRRKEKHTKFFLLLLAVYYLRSTPAAVLLSLFFVVWIFSLHIVPSVFFSFFFFLWLNSWANWWDCSDYYLKKKKKNNKLQKWICLTHVMSINSRFNFIIWWPSPKFFDRGQNDICLIRARAEKSPRGKYPRADWMKSSKKEGRPSF